jgi:hypothetical protein
MKEKFEERKLTGTFTISLNRGGKVVDHTLSGLTLKDRQIINDARERKIPVFIFTAKDSLSLRAMWIYRSLCKRFCSEPHIEGVKARCAEFADWQEAHQDIVKLPD